MGMTDCSKKWRGTAEEMAGDRRRNGGGPRKKWRGTAEEMTGTAEGMAVTAEKMTVTAGKEKGYVIY